MKQHNLLRLKAFYPGQWGIEGSDNPLGIRLLPEGNVYYLNPSHPDAVDTGNQGTSPDHPFLTLPAAYAACEDGNNDMIIYQGGPTSLTLDEALVWAKDYTHLIGDCAPVRVSKRARIFQDAAATGLSPLLDITATGCHFENFMIFQGVDDDASLVNVRVSGDRNFFWNVHFAGGGHATQAINGGASLVINGGEENDFVECVIGLDTIAAGDGMAGLVIAATGGAARNRFIDCDFLLYAGNAGAIFAELLGNSGLDRFLKFQNCDFINLSTTEMTQVFAVDAGFDISNKRVLLRDCTKIGAGKWDNGDTGLIMGNMDAYTGADESGEYVNMFT